MITTTSNKLAAFLSCREACVLTAYPDGPGYSIGMGSQTNVVEGMTITLQDAFTRLKKDIEAREPIVAKAIQAPLNQNQFDAVFDLYYQSGTASLKAIAAVLNKVPSGYLNAKFDGIDTRVANGIPLDPVSIEFQNHAIDVNGGKTEISVGLMRRRNLEIDVFWRADYGDLSSILVYDGNPHVVKPSSVPFDYASFGA